MRYLLPVVVGAGVALGLVLSRTASAAPAQAGHYPPFSPELTSLFARAAPLVSVPVSWASEEGLHHLIRRESAGWVGRPNGSGYPGISSPDRRAEWPSIWAELRQGTKRKCRNGGSPSSDCYPDCYCSASGLGQLLLGNVDSYYPQGRAGIGDAANEAAGMMAYIRERYGTPIEAWRRYGTEFAGY